MLETHGHADMYGAIVTPTTSPNSDLVVLFMHNTGWSTIYIVAPFTSLLETSPPPPTFLDLDCEQLAAKCGLRINALTSQVTARATLSLDGQRVTHVAFRDVPSFVYVLDQSVDMPGWGHVRCDLAFSGASYAYIGVAVLGLLLDAASYHQLIEARTAIKRTIMTMREIRHPSAPDFGFLYGVIFNDPLHNPAHQVRKVCVFADGEMDRSPTNTREESREQPWDTRTVGCWPANRSPSRASLARPSPSQSLVKRASRVSVGYPGGLRSGVHHRPA